LSRQKAAALSLSQRAVRLAEQSSWAHAFAAWAEPSSSESIPEPEPLLDSEWKRALEGWTVARPLEFEISGRRYVGGAAYQIIAAQSQDILTVLMDASQLPLALPLTHEAVQISGPPRLLPNPGASWTDSEGIAILLSQGTSLMRAHYAISLARPDAHTLRFTLDPSHEHDVRDARGYFTAHQLNRTHSLVTVFVGVDLGAGLATAFLRRKVQKAALATPAHIRGYVEPLVQQECERADAGRGAEAVVQGNSGAPTHS
jgi:hypothetical protein